MNLKSGRVTYWHPNVRSGVLRDKHWWGGGTYIYYKPPRLSKAGNVYCIAEEEPIEYERCEPVVSAFHQNSWSYVKRVRNNIGSFALLHSDEQKLRFAGLLKSNRTHNREVANTWPPEISMSRQSITCVRTGWGCWNRQSRDRHEQALRYPPLTKQN